MGSTKIYGIMVIYNRYLKNSIAYNSLKCYKDMTIIICDNSDNISYGNKEQADEDGLVYISMRGNKGLSHAYNAGIDYIAGIEGSFEGAKDKAVCFFDDDTEIRYAYFAAVESWLMQKGSKSIMLPIVKDSAGIMSPVLMKKNICKRFKSVSKAKEAESSTLSGINSGMAVKLAVYEDYRYDENMFLDYIDHRFIMDMRKLGITPQIVNVEMTQNFSAVTDSAVAAVRRFAIQKKDLKIFYGRDKLTYYRVVCKKHIKMAIKYRDFKMLFC